MGLTAWAIDKSRVTLVTALVVAGAGYQSYVNMPRAEDPGFVIRVALVITRFPGASPERVEQLITDKLEKAVQEMPELDYITSNSKTGVSELMVNFKESYRDMRPIFDSLRRKIDSARGDLPDGVIGPFVNDEFGDVFGTIVTITGSDFEYAELKLIADEVRDGLLLVTDVAKVEIYGAQDERVFVEYNNARLSEIGLSPEQLRNILAARNIVSPGGNIDTGDEILVLEPSGNFETIDELGQTVINLPGSRDLLLLRDVAEIYRGYVDPPESKVRASGVQGLALAISMREGGNILLLGEGVRAKIDELTAFYPIGVDFDYVQFQAAEVQTLVDDFIGNLLQAVGIVAAIMLLFLGVRTGLVVASLIPAAILASLTLMGFFAIGLDQMSIAALIISLGLLVDNAIVMSESIMVAMAEGKPRVRAAVDSANELRIPLLTSSLTTAAAFLPIYLAENATGEYTAPLFKVVSLTLLSSWLISMTLIPLLCVLFLKVKPAVKAASPDGSGGIFDTAFYRFYRRALVRSIRWRWASLAAVAAVFVATMSLFGLIPNIFFPPGSRATLTVELELPAGTPIARTEQMAERFDAFIAEELVVGADRPEGVTTWASFIGRGAPRYVLPYGPEQPNPSYAYLLVNTTSRRLVDEIMPRVERFGADHFPDLKITARPIPLGPPAWPPVAVRISGRNSEVLFDIVEQVKARLHEIPGTKLIDDDWGARSKKLVVQVDQPRALRAGVSSQDIAVSLQSFLSGIVTTEYREGDKIIPVTLRSVAAQRNNLDRLESLNVYSQSSGLSVPLKQVADVRLEWQPSTIRRRSRLRTVTVEAGTEPGVTAADINAQLQPWLDELQADWGPGYSFELGGEQENSGDANAAIGAKLPIAAMIIVLLLVGQFNSVRKPLIVLITIPLGLIGVVLGLLATQLYFGFMTLLGIISLSEIVINNAIVLIDRINIEIETNGLQPAAAIIESAQRRLRPIVMTTCTTVGGLLPLYLGGGPMWEPLAVAIMGGLIFATLLTLGVVPILYAVFFRVSLADYTG